MGIQILSGLQALGTTRPARSRFVKSPEWQEIVKVLSNGGLNPGETLRITISPETQKLTKNPALGLRQLLLNTLQPLWRKDLAPRYRVSVGPNCLLITSPRTDEGRTSAVTAPQAEGSAAVEVLSTVQRLIGSRPGHSPLLRTAEWREIIEAVMVRGIKQGELLRVPLSPATQELLKNRPGGLKRLLVNGLRPLWSEGLIPELRITQRKDSVTIENRKEPKRVDGDIYGISISRNG